ncbi:MAG: FecR family protein [Mangrovibacterium sp.]
MEKDLKILFQKYQEGKINLQEELILAEKLADPSISEADHLLRTGLNQSFENSPEEIRNLDHLLHEIHHHIRLRQSEKEKKTVYRISRWASRAAAILFIPLLAATLYLQLHNTKSDRNDVMLQIVAPKGARVNFELPDGTTGTLNNGTRLNYSSGFAKNRHVELVGEAWFDVAKDKQYPFTIDANENKITVVGTRFSLSAWPADKTTELVLEEGKVLLESAALSKAIEVAPGERIIEKEGKVERNKVESWKYTAWKEGKLVFRNDSMQELARRISRWYNVDVEIRGEGLKEYKFRGVFEDDPLEEVLRLLKITSPIDYEILDRQSNADRSFSRKQVILTQK